MTSAETKLKKAAVLGNITDLRPTLDNGPRWSGKFEIFARFDRMRDDLIEASEDEDTDLVLNASPVFANMTRKYSRMLHEINCVTKYLQSNGHRRTDCRDDLEALIEAVHDEMDNAKDLPLAYSKANIV